MGIADTPTVYEFLAKDSPSLSPPTASALPFEGYNVRGILRDNNFSDVPDGKQGLTNLLSNAFGVNYIYDDVAVVNGINDTEFIRTRDYPRLYGNKSTSENNIVVRDIDKIRNSLGVDATAIPLQTIANKISGITDYIGSPSNSNQGGDGLIGEYYSFSDVYGDKDEIFSTGGGTYVVGQAQSDSNTYASPNSYVEPEADESFFGYDGSDLASVDPIEKTQDWFNGFFNFGSAGLHPSGGIGGIVKYHGYFNPGESVYVKKGTDSNGTRHTPFLYIVQDSRDAAHNNNTELPQTTVPTIWRLWELDTNGDRLSDVPTSVGRFAPLTGDSPKTSVYSFTNTVTGIPINDKLDSPDSGSTDVSSKFGKVVKLGHKIDGPRDCPSRVTVPFKIRTFYETEIYFILSPRVIREIEASDNFSSTDKTVFLAGHDSINGGLLTLPRDYFWSQNPLKSSKKGSYPTFIKNSIPIHGSSFDASPKSHVDTFGESSNGGANYRSLRSSSRVRITYKPPHKWSQIDKGTEVTNHFKDQVDSGTVFHDTTRTSFSAGDGDTYEQGNLIIDDSSPNSGVLAPLTYLKSKENALHNSLSKTSVRTKSLSTSIDSIRGRTRFRYIDHKGLKGYGQGSLKFINGFGINDVDSVYLSPTFYHGESPDFNDIIIFEDYNNSPFIKVFDTDGGSPSKSRLMINTLSKSNTIFNNVIPFNSPLGTRYDTYHLTKPAGEKYFVYSFRGIQDKSLNSFCSVAETTESVIQAITRREAATGISSPVIEKDTLVSFDGDLITEANNTPLGGGILGLTADYNSADIPGTTKSVIIRKALDGRLPPTLTLSSFAGTNSNTPSGSYVLNQYGSSPSTALEHQFVSIAGSSIGDHYYEKIGNPSMRVQFDKSTSKWIVAGKLDGVSTITIRARKTGGSKYQLPSNGAFSEFVAPTTGGSITSIGTTLASTTVDDTPNSYTLILNSPATLAQSNAGAGNGVYPLHTLVQTLKRGFGITITNSPSTADKQYLCFPPTDTAPPFRATNSGLRTLPDNVTNGSLTRLINIYASPTATTGHANNTPLTSIKTGQIILRGGYFDSPGNNSSPGGVVTLDTSSGTDNFTRKIKFTFKNKSNVDQTFSILATTDSTA
tara:strand:- start:13 stop:3378 length:3366 start_codon:yes stop_codon:yes gene_type:complete